MGNMLVEALSTLTRTKCWVRKDILLLEFTVSNACIISGLGKQKDQWVLVDTGLENSGDFIRHVVEDELGSGKKPEAIILTHGHFDHVGSVFELATHWDVPVYIHPLELPYVTGKKDYPLADTEVDDGWIAKLSKSFPHTSIDLGDRVHPLPEDGTIPHLLEWRFILVPGHTEGQIALFRERDGVLIASDAFTTVKQESLMSVLSQHETVSGPPKYFTTNWEEAKKSIQKIIDLNPQLAIVSHGQPIEGEELRNRLQELMNHFDEVAKPHHKKRVEQMKKD